MILSLPPEQFLCDGEIVAECRLSKYTGINLEERTREVTRRMQAMGIRPIEIVIKENAYRLKTVVFLKYANRI